MASPNRRVRVYIAAPYPKGSLMDCARRAHEASRRLVEAGFAPLVPHPAELLGSAAVPGSAEACLAWLEAAEAVVRLPGQCPAAAREVKHAEEKGIPVYPSVDDLIAAY